jgi:hypothetical protein
MFSATSSRKHVAPFKETENDNMETLAKSYPFYNPYYYPIPYYTNPFGFYPMIPYPYG